MLILYLSVDIEVLSLQVADKNRIAVYVGVALRKHVALYIRALHSRIAAPSIADEHTVHRP